MRRTSLLAAAILATMLAACADVSTAPVRPRLTTPRHSLGDCIVDSTGDSTSLSGYSTAGGC